MAAEQEPEEIPGVTRPFTLAEAVLKVRDTYETNGTLDPISANPEEVPGGGIVFWDPAKSRAIIKPYNPNAQPIPTTSVITTGKEGNPPEIILPPKSNNNN